MEVLKLMGVYDTELYKSIENSRKARNKWMHKLEEPSDSDLHHIAFAVRELIERHYGFDLQFHVRNYSGGDAQWNVWLDENFAQNSRANS